MDHHAFLIKSALSAGDVWQSAKGLGEKAVGGLASVGRGAGRLAERAGLKGPTKWLNAEDKMYDLWADELERKQLIRQALVGAGVIGGGAAAVGGLGYGAHKLLKSRTEKSGDPNENL